MSSSESSKYHQQQPRSFLSSASQSSANLDRQTEAAATTSNKPPSDLTTPTMDTNGNGGSGGSGLPAAPVRTQRNNNHQQQRRHQVDYGAPESMVRHTNSANCSFYHTHGGADCEQSIASGRAAAISSEATSQRNFDFNAAAARQQVPAEGGHFNTVVAARTRPIENTNDSQATSTRHHHQFQAQSTQNHTAGHYAAKQQQPPMHHHQNHAHLGNPNTNNNYYHHYHAQRPTAATNRRNCDQMSCPCDGEEQKKDSQEQDRQDYEHELRFGYEQYEQQDHYANQLRRSQQQHRIGLHQHQTSSRQQLQQANASYSAAGQSASSSRRPQASQQQQQLPTSSTNMGNNAHSQQQAREAPHVNFNRSSQKGAGFALCGDDDDESGETTRKKKYLTAKYGQQQMNLIKKRLKIEMWLHEQLQELAKQSKSAHQDEVDEIDIDLDQLLDMDDDQTRRHWLRKTLSPLSDLPSESIEKFVCDVLEQSKLL